MNQHTDVKVVWPSGAELEAQTIAYLEVLPEANRANLKYRATEGLLDWGIWVADDLREGEVVARTCLIGAAAPLDLVNGPAETALCTVLRDVLGEDVVQDNYAYWDEDTGEDYDEPVVTSSRPDHDALAPSQAFEWFLRDARNVVFRAREDRLLPPTVDVNDLALGRAQSHILIAIAAFESQHGPIPDPVLPASLTQ